MTTQVERPPAPEPTGLDGPLSDALIGTRRFFAQRHGVRRRSHPAPDRGA